MERTGYVVLFTLGMTVLVALLLSALFYGTKEQAAINEDVFNKRAILGAISDHIDTNVKSMSDADVLGIFNDQIEQVVLDMDGAVVDGVKAEKIDMAKEKKKPEATRKLPLYVYNKADGEKFYIVSVRGSGLWDEIWGNIAIGSDFSTVAGASFDHKGETPGLGAEIKDNPVFSRNFKGTKIYDDAGNYTSVRVRKGGAKDKMHEVDGISGATVTADGVAEMLYRGIKYYQPYFEKLKSGKGKPIGMLVE